MAHLTDIPKNFEIWAGGPNGLRLRRHPQISQALAYRDEYPMMIRQTTVSEAGRLTAQDRPRITLSSLPVFRRSSVGETVELLVEVDCPAFEPRGPIQFARLIIETADTQLEEHVILKLGKRQSLHLPFPAFAAGTDFTVSLELRDRGEAGRVRACFSLLPEKRLTLYYAFQTHLDLGWTGRVAPTVEALKKMTAEVAIKVCRQFENRPEGEKFIWTCECSDALRMAWAGTFGAQRQELREFVRRGLIQCCALPFSCHTGLMSRDLLRRSIERSHALRRELDVPELDLSVAQSNDVPGHSWIVPDVLAEMGIHRAMIGHNPMVRGCLLPPLFYWQGPAGGRVLTLATSCVDYGAAFPVPKSPREFFGLSANNPEALQLPGTAVMRFIGYGENCGPDGAEREINAIAAWNEEYAWPRLLIGGPKDYFNHIEPETDPANLPVISKEISDWWIHGPASTPRAMAQYRKVMIALPRLAGTVSAEATADRARLAEIEENLILHAEHTFGLNAQLVQPIALAQSWSLNGLDHYVRSWEDKEQYAANAVAQLGVLQCLYPPPPPATATGAGRWQIGWDGTGVVRLTDPNGTCWYDRNALPEAPPFAGLTQQLFGQELDEWFHHNPAAAPHAGDYHFIPAVVTDYEDPESRGVMLSGKLDSPAGAIASVVITVGSALHAPDLIIGVALRDKLPTAQAECLTLALPFLCGAPKFRTDVGGALLTVDDDQLIDANRDAHPVITGWLMEDGTKASTIAVSSAEVFLWHFGERRLCWWNKAPAKRQPTAYAHLFNNLWNTNFRCWIGGDLNYTIRVRRGSDQPLAELQQMSELWQPAHVKADRG